jgi:hypothetical protein
MTLIIGNIEGVFILVKAFPFVEVQSQAYWVGIVFVSFSFIFAFFGYVSDLKAREDILSPLRKLLVGYWRVRAQSWTIEHGKIEFWYVTNFCTIGIEDVGRKLIMHFEIRDSDVFKDQELDVTAVTLDYQGEPRKLIYFYDTALALKNPIGSGAGQLAAVNFPFVGILNVVVKNGEVNKMEGRWYDIDNAVYNLARQIPELKGFQELAQSVQSGAVTFKGDLEFARLPALPGK